MSAAVLTILGDASGVKRALGETIAESRRASATISAQARTDASLRRQLLSNEGALARARLREEGADRRQAAAERARAERAAQGVRERGAAREAALARKAAADASALERAKTTAAGRESAARIAAASREATAKKRLDDRVLARAVRDEQRKTAVEEREGRRRTRLAENEAKARARGVARAEREARADLRRGVGWGRRLAGATLGGARDYATSMSDQVQAARGRRAPAERAIGNAVYQAGGGRAAALEATGQITRFAAAQGMDSGELADALQAAQTEFSVLGNAQTSSADRGRRLQGFLANAQLARDTGNDVGEFARLSGLFQQTGFDPATQRRLMLYTAGATQRGAVETGSVTREAMPAITARMGSAMARARRAGGDVQGAAVQEYAQALAEIEVARGTQGATPRLAGNAMRDVSNALQGNVTQGKLLQNIRSSQGRDSAIERTLYEADPTRRGQQRLRARYTNALDLVGAFGEAGLDSTQFQNITGGGGHGNPLSILANQRRLLGGLLNTDNEGKSGVSRVRELMNIPGVSLSEADVDRGRGIFSADTTAELNRNQESNTNALRDNNTRLVGVSDAITNWRMRNPWLAEGAAQGVGAAGKVGSTGLDIATQVGATAAGGGVLAGAKRGLPAARSALGRFAPLLGLAGGVAAGGVLGGSALGLYGSMETARTGRGADGRQVSTGERIGRGAAALGAGALFAPAALISAIRDLPRLFGQELQVRPLVATVSPHDAALAGTGPSSASMPPTP